MEEEEEENYDVNHQFKLTNFHFLKRKLENQEAWWSLEMVFEYMGI